MFIDEVVMEVEAGRGGDGCMAYRREKFVPMGGPNGGSGGRGSNIIFKTDTGLKTLIDLRYMKKIKGDPGENGEGKNQTGKDSIDKIIKVPIGTTVRDAETGAIIADFIASREEKPAVWKVAIASGIFHVGQAWGTMVPSWFFLESYKAEWIGRGQTPETMDQMIRFTSGFMGVVSTLIVFALSFAGVFLGWLILRKHLKENKKVES